ncbi:MAG: hypothetical protein KDA75_19470, partial [Planctomycetaceae bacterium]|nr:hypothetical protein [Planctomycetaceae bacterium]
LLIVTADHGVAFKTNHSRRDPVPETLPHILPVPLFIKLPGKQAGDVTDRNVECIDLLPTIANIIDIDLPGPVDGASILDPRETPRPRKTLVLPRGQLAIDPDFPERFSYVDEMVRLFGSGTGDDRLLDFDLHPEWIGKPRQEFPLGPKSPISIQLEWGGDYVSPSQSDIIPCFFKGWAIAPEETALSLTIAVEVNGEIAGVTRTFNDPEAADRWCTMTDERRFHVGHNDVHIYEVREVDGKYQFCPCDVPELAGSRRRSSPQSDTREPD